MFDSNFLLKETVTQNKNVVTFVDSIFHAQPGNCMPIFVLKK